jgi:hypothetical protein
MDISTHISFTNSSTDTYCESYIEGQTLNSITNDINTNLAVFLGKRIDDEQVQFIAGKLKEYRWVADTNNLHLGVHVRWITSSGLSRGGIVVGFHTTDTGTNVKVWNNYSKRNMQYKFEQGLTFQKLTEQEIIVLLAGNLR